MPTQVKSWESRGSRELFDRREDAEASEVEWALATMKGTRGPADEVVNSDVVKLAVTILAERVGILDPTHETGEDKP